MNETTEKTIAKGIIEDFVHGLIYELLSSKVIPRTRNFYKKDKEGYYYIPEVKK